MHGILIVDDSLFIRYVLKNILEKAGYKVIGEAENGVEAIEMYKKLTPDLVTLDITMPKMNGIDTLKKIVALDKEAKVVMISAMGQKNLIFKSIKIGAKDFVIKPFNEDMVERTLKKVLHH